MVTTAAQQEEIGAERLSSSQAATATATAPFGIDPSSSSPSVVEVVAPSKPPPPPPLCKHWARSKRCLYHAKGKCKFDHPPDYQVPPPPTTSTHGKRRTTSRQTGDLSHRHRSAGGRLQTRNDARVAILRAFLAETLASRGIHDLTSLNVLDVAGGKGELAFQLLNLNNVQRCHVIDPRPLSLGRFQKRLSRGFYHRSQGILQTDVVRPRTEPERPVDQLRCFFSSELWEETSGGEHETEESNDNIGDSSSSSSSKIDKYQKQRAKFFENCYKAKGWVWPPVGGINEHASCSKNYEDRDDLPSTKATTTTAMGTKKQTKLPIKENAETTLKSKDRSVDADAAKDTDTNAAAKEETPTGSSSLGIAFDHASSVVKTADLIVGMHPDQAVDAIVDAALYQNISFFVVPCCTYSREFPNRRIPVPTIKKKDTNGNHETKDGDDAPNGLAARLSITNTKLVTTYEELVDYLQAKSPDIQRHVLPFEGRNICLYRVVPPRKPQGDKGKNPSSQ